MIVILQTCAPPLKRVCLGHPDTSIKMLELWPLPPMRSSQHIDLPEIVFTRSTWLCNDVFDNQRLKIDNTAQAILFLKTTSKHTEET